jgi:hypothetical protein
MTNSEKPRPVSASAPATHNAAALPSNGEKKIDTKPSGNVIIPAIIHGRRGPSRDTVESDNLPTIGL